MFARIRKRLLTDAAPIICLWVLLPAGSLAADQDLDADFYDQKIKPLLAEKCVSCHGPLKSESGLRLDAIQLIHQGGDSGRVVSAGRPTESEMVVRVATADLDLRMPPEGTATPLTTPQIKLLERWIAAEMPGPEREDFLRGPQEHWAYQPIIRPELVSQVPAESAIDQLLREEQSQRGLSPVAQATELVWLRRVTLDLSGLPPTVDQLLAFQSDISQDRREKAVDRLLASPKYGERWGRHWMDVWRYSDWDGYKQEVRGSQRHIWHWRDWIVESLNANKPYDEMVVEMLAADELAPGDESGLRATGFLARNFHVSNRNIWLDATVEHTGKAFLGLTLNCARCHDHKYDPVPQTAYYQFRAIFEPHRIRTDQLAGQGDITRAGIPRAFDAEPDAKTFVFLRGNDKHPLEDAPVEADVLDWIPAPFQIEPVDLPLESYYPELSPVVRKNAMDLKRQAVATALKALEDALAKIKEKQNIEETEAMAARIDAFDQYQLADLKYQTALADLLSLASRYAADELKYRAGDKNGAIEIEEVSRRAALAERRHRRLLAEAQVRLQQQALEKAKTSSEADNDKRVAAIKAARKALTEAESKLDEIPREIADDSADYTPVGKILPKSSTGRRLGLARWIVDRRNPLTARVAANHIWMRHFGSPLVDNVFDFGMKTPKPQLARVLDWLAAELLATDWDMKHLHRLIVLSDAYGRSSKADVRYARNQELDPDNRLLWRANVRRLDAEQMRDSLLALGQTLDHSFSGPDIDFELGESIPRRSLYFRHAYEKQMAMLVVFDAASPNECYRRRPSVIPQQALVLINSSLARSMARRLAGHLAQPEEGKEGVSSAEFTRRLFWATLSRMPTEDELASCTEFLDRQSDVLSKPHELSSFQGGAKTDVPANQSPALRARESLALVLFNHNDFVSIR